MWVTIVSRKLRSCNIIDDFNDFKGNHAIIHGNLLIFSQNNVWANYRVIGQLPTAAPQPASNLNDFVSHIF